MTALEQATEALRDEVSRANSEERKLWEGVHPGEEVGLFAMVMLGASEAETILAALRAQREREAAALEAARREGAREAGGPLLRAIRAELDRAYAKHGREPWSRHEFYAILLEEVEELWDAIKHDESPERVAAELVQVAAMCFRYAETSEGAAAAIRALAEKERGK